MTAVLFGRPSRPAMDDRFELEAEALEELGVEAHAIALDPVVLGDAERALEVLPRPRGRDWLYRGWMLREDEYAALEEALAERGESLVVDAERYALATYAPAWTPLLGAHTAPARWTDEPDVREAWELAQELGPPPWIVKDHVKSAKEDWLRACWVPPGADFDAFASVCAALLDLRGDAFERGFLIKRQLPLARLPGFLSEGRPATDEHRLFFWRGELVAHAPYWDADGALAAPEEFAWLGDAIDSPFFVADVAPLEGGGATVLEINDGGTAWLPERLDPRELYAAIFRRALRTRDRDGRPSRGSGRASRRRRR